MKKYLTDEIIENPLKKKNTSKKNKKTETKIRTLILLTSCLPYFFTVEKKSICSKHVFSETIQSHWRFIS